MRWGEQKELRKVPKAGVQATLGRVSEVSQLQIITLILYLCVHCLRKSISRIPWHADLAILRVVHSQLIACH